MPIVTITLFEGRDDNAKDALAREVADAVATHTGNSIDDVHVIFDEVKRNNWSRALTLASRRAPRAVAAAVRAGFASVSRIKYDQATEVAYLRLRREVINPGMATQPGFISSLLMRPHEKEHEYLLVNKWVSKEHAAAYTAGPVHDRLREQALMLLPERLQTTGADVVHLDG